MTSEIVLHGSTATEIIARAKSFADTRPTLTPVAALNVALTEHPVTPDVVKQVYMLYHPKNE